MEEQCTCTHNGHVKVLNALRQSVDHLQYSETQHPDKWELSGVFGLRPADANGRLGRIRLQGSPCWRHTPMPDTGLPFAQHPLERRQQFHLLGVLLVEGSLDALHSRPWRDPCLPLPC